MKRLNRIFSLIIGILMATAAIAQETETGGQSFFGENGEIASNLPTSIPLKDRKPIEYNNPRADDIIWSKVIYRVIDMHEKINYPLYFPTMASDNRQSLFTTIFRLFEEGKIQAYEFEADREIFTEDRLVKFEDFLAKNEIMVEAEVDSITGDTLSTYIDESNIPNVEVLKYYLKEVWYFDKNNSTFSVRILAICPKIYRENYDMGGQLLFRPVLLVGGDPQPAALDDVHRVRLVLLVEEDGLFPQLHRLAAGGQGGPAPQVHGDPGGNLPLGALAHTLRPSFPAAGPHFNFFSNTIF